MFIRHNHIVQVKKIMNRDKKICDMITSGGPNQDIKSR